MTTTTVAFMGLPGGTEWIVLLMIGLLLFGRRLPEVGRSLGRSIVEFKKGIKGVEEEIEQESNSTGQLTPESTEQLSGQSESPNAMPRYTSTTATETREETKQPQQ